jgi:cytochrome b561
MRYSRRHGLGLAVNAWLVLRNRPVRFGRAEPAARAVQLAAKAAHVGLYVLLLAMPLSGWLMTTTTPVRVPTSVFGLFTLPYPVTPDLRAYRLARGIHVVSAVALAALIALHVAAALTHALLWRDRTLMRMWRKPFAAEAIPTE